MNEDQEATTTTPQEAPGQGTSKGMGPQGARILARLILGSYIFAAVWQLIRLPEIITAIVASGTPTYEAITIVVMFTSIVGPIIGYMVGVTG